MTEADAYTAFLHWRWPETSGRPVCPKCRSRRVYNGKTARRLFHCANPTCRYQFTATSKTLFAGRKMAFSRIMIALDSAGECPALELKRRLGCQYKSAYVMAQKLAADDPQQWVGYFQNPGGRGAQGIETEGQDREDGLGAEHESPVTK